MSSINGWDLGEMNEDDVHRTMQAFSQVQEELAEYKELERQGRLVKLPCKAGEIVYVHFYGEVILALLDEYTILSNGTIIAKVYIDPDTYEEYEISEIYLTPKEATLKGADK